MTASLQPDRMPGYVLPNYEFRRPPELSGGESPLYPVAIVGAGLAGLVSALELGSRGVAERIRGKGVTWNEGGACSRR
jgi:3-(3-hydroxy-phenyl)propionate hydroxylase